MMQFKVSILKQSSDKITFTSSQGNGTNKIALLYPLNPSRYIHLCLGLKHTVSLLFVTKQRKKNFHSSNSSINCSTAENFSLVEVNLTCQIGMDRLSFCVTTQKATRPIN